MAQVILYESGQSSLKGFLGGDNCCCIQIRIQNLKDRRILQIHREAFVTEVLLHLSYRIIAEVGD